MPADPWAEFEDVTPAPRAAGADPWAEFEDVSAPETSFPTPMETAGRMGMGALKAVPGMARGMIEGAAGPFMTAPREIYAAVTGGPSPTMQRFRQTAGALREGDYLGAVPMVGPLAKQVIQGGKEILTPARKAGLLDAELAMLGMAPGGGVGTVTTDEMNTAADTGGAAVANLAAPEIARGGVAVAGKLPGVGKLLKFAGPATAIVSGHPALGLKMLLKGAVTDAVLKPMSKIMVDSFLESVAARDANGAAAAIAKGLEKSPEAAKAFATAMEEQANAAAPSGAPKMLPPMSDATPGAVAARAADRTARQQAAMTRGPAPEAPQSTLQRPAFVDEAQGVHAYDRSPSGYGRGSAVNPGPWEGVDALPEPVKTPRMPVPGNVKPATVFTKPGPKVKPAAGESPSAKALAERQKTVADPEAIRAAFGEAPKGAPHGTKGPSGAPLTAAERKAALEKLQRALASDVDIWAAFGLEN